MIATTEGLPSENTLKIGLKHLNEYLTKKRDIIIPLTNVAVNDFNNYLMLGYYRNPLNFIFYNEGVIITSMIAFGYDRAWNEKNAINLD